MINCDEKTGIHYGAISQHSIDQEALDDIYTGPHSTDLAYEQWKGSLEAEIIRGADDYMSDDQIKRFVEHCMDWDELGDCYSGDEIDPRYDDGKYIILKCLQSDLFITKSPFYTYAKPCSPCVPNAGDLDRPSTTGFKTYCLGHEWFSEDEMPPYPIYKTVMDQEVQVWRIEAMDDCMVCKGDGDLEDGKKVCRNCNGTGLTFQKVLAYGFTVEPKVNGPAGGVETCNLSSDQEPQFWGVYRLGEDMLPDHMADFDTREEALAAVERLKTSGKIEPRS